MWHDDDGDGAIADDPDGDVLAGGGEAGDVDYAHASSSRPQP